MFPTRIQLSKRTWDKLQYIQSQTRITPNISARIAMALALRDGHKTSVITIAPVEIHVINRDVLFGEHEAAYSALIRQFCHDHKVTADIQSVVRSLIDNGLHMMGHIKRLSDLSTLFSNSEPRLEI